MNRFAFRTIASILALLVLALVLSIGPGQAQGPEGEGGEVGTQAKVGIAAYIAPALSYQGKLVEGGSPAHGTRSMVFRLYDAATGSTMVWEEGPKNVAVSNGLFQVTLGDTTAMDVNQFDQELWLEIVVQGTALPRQRLLGAPYAYSLAPGADVSGSLGAGWSVLYVDNKDLGIGLLGRSQGGDGVRGDSVAGHGVYAVSYGSGLDGAALHAYGLGTDGVALWAKSNSTDTSLVVENDGAGDLIAGLGGDGGGDEFRVRNDGTIETKADSFLFVPGNAFVRDSSSDTTRWDANTNGSAQIWRGSAAGDKVIYIPITIPAVLYGQPVKIEGVTVYYRCQDGSQNYISRTYLYKQGGVDSQVAIIQDETDRTSSAASSYALIPATNNTLSAAQGTLGLSLTLRFVDDANYVQIGGVRLQIGHHELY
jgi:hypothetical protein